MSDKIEKFISSMSLVFPKRFEDERQQVEWFKTWERALKNFEPWVVEGATQRIIDTRDERSFPLVAEVRKTCMDVIRDDRASKPELAVKPADQHADPVALADALIDCQLGRTAARANPSWIVPLHDFCREHKRLPFSNEIDRIKKIAGDGEQIEYGIAAGKIHVHPVLKDFHGKVKLRRERLRRTLLGADADTPTPSTFAPDPDWMSKALAAHHAREAARDPQNAERYRLAREWRDRVCEQYGSVDRYLELKRPPGNVDQNTRRGK